MSELSSKLLGPAVGDVLLGRYRIEQMLGSGPFATVYKAADLELKSALVAIKRIHPHVITSEKVKIALRSRVLDMRQLSHANVIRTFDLEESKEKEFFIVTELCEGWNLAQLLDERHGHPLKTNTAIFILSQVLAALNYAHGKGILHTNLKPQNILISRNGEVKLTDFSLNIAFEQADGFTSTGEGIANPSYMAPEQFTLAPISAQTDLYSWGVLGYQLVCGSQAMPAKDYLSCARTHISGALPTLFSKLEIPAWLEKLFAACCAADPASRPQSAREIHDEFTNWQNEHSLDTKQLQQSLTPRQLRDKRKRWRTGIQMFCFLVFVAVCLVLSQTRPQQGLVAAYLRLEHNWGLDLQILKKVIGINYNFSSPQEVIKAVKAKDTFILGTLLSNIRDDGKPNDAGEIASFMVFETYSELFFEHLDNFVALNSRNAVGNTFLHLLAQQNGFEEAIEKLLQRNASPFTLNSLGQSPVHLAVVVEHHANLKKLLSVPEAVRSRTKNGQTPIMYALQSFTTEEKLLVTLTILIDHGAEIQAVDNFGKGTRQYAQETGIPSVLALIEKQMAVEAEKFRLEAQP